MIPTTELEEALTAIVHRTDCTLNRDDADPIIVTWTALLIAFSLSASLEASVTLS